MRALANRRALNPRLVKRNVTYSLVEVSELFGVHLNTVRNWQSEGLITIDQHTINFLCHRDVTVIQ